MPEVDPLEEREGGEAEAESASLRRHLDPAGVPSPDLWRQAIEDFNDMEVEASGLWQELGPSPLGAQVSPMPLSGTVTDIAVDPSGTADDKIYIATSGGGIWKTEDAGLTWRSLTDRLRALSFGAIALDPVNRHVLYAGTGAIFRSNASLYMRVGVYKSVDEGATWFIADGGFFGTVIRDLGVSRIVLPASDIVLVATGGAGAPAQNEGLYRSIDGGAHFGSAISGNFDDGKPVLAGRITDLRLDTQNSNIVYAAVSGKGIYKSTDQGATFSETAKLLDRMSVAGPFSDIVFCQSTLRAGVADSKTFYACVQYDDPDSGKSQFKGLFKLVSGVKDWEQMPQARQRAAEFNEDQSNYDMTIGVDPKDPDHVYFALQKIFGSTDGGVTFAAVPDFTGFLHLDHHALAFSPHSSSAPTEFYVGTDGGIYKWGLPPGATTGKNGYQNLNVGGIGSSLIYSIDIGHGPGKNDVTYAGFQDNGTAVRGVLPGLLWDSLQGGDGYLTVVDPADSKIAYGFSTGNLIKTVDQGVKTDTVFTDARPWNERALAIERNGADPAKRLVYLGIQKTFFRSENAGKNFVQYRNFSSVISCIATQPAGSAVIQSGDVWVGLEDGTVHYSTDRGETWDRDTSSSLGVKRAVSCIAVDPADPLRIAVAYSRYLRSNPKYLTRHIFLSGDGGKSWRDIGGADGLGPATNVPDIPVGSVVFDSSTSPSSLLLATAAGVLVSRDDGAKWSILGVGLPTVDCTSLAIDNSIPPVIRVGTFGRGCWELTRHPGPRMFIQANLAFGAVPVGQTGELTARVWNTGSGNPLTIQGVDVPAGLGDFSLDPGVTLSPVAPGKSLNLPIRFQATAGEKTGALVVRSDDFFTPNLQLHVSGSGVAPGGPARLGLRPRNLYFGPTTISKPRKLTVRALNVGQSDLNLKGLKRVEGDDAFTDPVGPSLPQTIGLKEDKAFDIDFKPGPAFSVVASTGDFAAIYDTQSNDPRPLVRFTATGKRIGGRYPLLDVILLFTAIGTGPGILGLITFFSEDESE